MEKNKKNRKMNIFYVALYMRLSREDGDKDESDSIANQRKLLSSYVDKNDDFIIQSEFADDGYSGTNFNRPDFQKMIADIEIGKINCVIVKDLSRFGRDYIKTGYYLEEYFIDKNIRFIAINDNIDSFIRDYDMLMPVKNVFNAQYARDISQKVQSSFKVKQNSGEFIGAFPSYGYKKSSHDRHKLVIDEYAASIIRRIFDLYLSGFGKMKIARILNDENILCPASYKTVNGDKYVNSNRLPKTDYWTYSSIQKILNNEMYIGNMVQGKTKRRMKGKARPASRDEWIIVKGTHEPIIDHNTFEKVQTLLSKDTKQLSLSENVSIFAGFIRCGDCDRAMAKKKKYKKISSSIDTYIYQCGSYARYGKKYCSSHYIEHDVLEKVILADLKAIIESVKNLKELIEEMQKSIPLRSDILDVEKKKMEYEIEKVKKLKCELYEDYKEGLFSKSDYLTFRQNYEDKETRFLKQLKAIINKSREGLSVDVFKSKWIQYLLQVKSVEKLDRDIIIDMIDVIYIYEENKIKIIYNFSNELKDIFEVTYKFTETA